MNWLLLTEFQTSNIFFLGSTSLNSLKRDLVGELKELRRIRRRIRKSKTCSTRKDYIKTRHAAGGTGLILQAKSSLISIAVHECNKFRRMKKITFIWWLDRRLRWKEYILRNSKEWKIQQKMGFSEGNLSYL